MEQNKLFILLNLCNWLMCCSMSIIAPFFPTFAYSLGISSTMVGFIFSMHPLGGFLGSLYIGTILNDKNRMRTIIYCISAQAGCMMIFVLQYFVQEKYTIIITSIVVRFANGTAYSGLVCAFYSLIPKLFPQNFEKKIAQAQTSSSLGFMSGPFIGSLIYRIGGYTLPFITLAFATASCGVYLQFFVRPGQIEQQNLIEMQQLPTDTKPQLEIEKITYLNSLKIYGFFANVLLFVLGATLFSYPFPLLAQYLFQYYQIGAESVGFFMFIQPLAYTTGTFIIIYITIENKQLAIFIGMVISCLAQLFLGPDSGLIGVEKHISIYCLASIAYGLSVPFPLVYCLPQMKYHLLNKYPHLEDQCNNISAAVLSASFSLGEFIGPIISGVLYRFLEFDRIASIFGLVGLISCTAYLPLILKSKKKVEL